jgi:excisionase family DNA binding protein
MKKADKTPPSEREQARRRWQSKADRLAWPVKEGAHRLGIGRSTVYKLASEGKLRLIKVGGRTLVPDAEITRLVSGGV